MSDVRLIDPIFEDDDHAVVACFDEPGAGGACHRYGVVAHPEAPNREMVYANIKFQEGPVENNEWNGLPDGRSVTDYSGSVAGLSVGQVRLS